MPETTTPLLICDTREPHSGGFSDYFTVPWIREKLDVGDYSLCGATNWVSVERKTVDDLISCFCGERPRFVRELERFQRIPCRFIICEGSYADLLSGSYRSKMTPAAAFQSAVALMIRYSVPLLMANDCRTGAKLTESILLRWYKEHQSRVADVTNASSKYDRAG